MKKINIKAFILGALAAGSLTACTDGYLGFNTNPYEVTGEEMKRDGYLVRSALTGMQGWVIPTDVNCNQFTESLVGGPFSGYLAESNQGFGNRFSNFNQSNSWNRVFYKDIIPNIYSNLTQLKAVTDDEVFLSVGNIVKVAAIMRVTDTYGPIPYTKLGADGSLTAPLDAQQTVYKAMVQELDDAVKALLPHITESFTATADKVYEGNVAKWIKLANSYKLRLGMRAVYADPTWAQQVCETAVAPANGGVLESNADNAAIGGITNNPFRVVMYEYNGGDARIGADIICFMNGYNDPRRAAMFSKSTFTDASITNNYYGIRIGTDPIPSDKAHCYSNMVVTSTSPIMWMTSAEVQLLMAEGALRGWNMGGTAADLYAKGVTLSFEQWGVSGADAYLADNTSLPQLYVDPLGTYSYNGVQPTITVAFDQSADFETNLERIVTQKYIAMFPNGNEAWAEFRRTGYPRLMPVAVNKNVNQVPQGEFARRLWYPQEEYKDNGQNVAAAIADLTPQADLMSSRMWWDCNPRTK